MDKKDMNITDAFDVFPWDGAIILDDVLTARYGWVPATATPHFFGSILPASVHQPVARTRTSRPHLVLVWPPPTSTPSSRT
jgi:hypothetical protein